MLKWLNLRYYIFNPFYWIYIYSSENNIEGIYWNNVNGDGDDKDETTDVSKSDDDDDENELWWFW